MVNLLDWSKAKTILIVAFIVTNLLLGVVLFSDNRKVDSTTTQGFVEEVIKLLNNKDISIDTEISTETPKLNTLTVEYEIIELYEVNKNYFNGEGKVETEGQNVIKISNNNEYLAITNKKELLYENKDETKRYKDLNEEIAKDIALKFLQDKKYNTSDMILSYIKNENNNYYLEFSKVYKGRYLEKTKTNIEIDSRGVKSLERIWLNVLEEGETPIYISTAPKAILSLLSVEEVYGKTIKDISLSYSFDISEQNHIKDPKGAKKGGTVPAWRVLFEDGYKIIIDN